MAHCFFEQSGTFKNEFIKLGIPSADYDIQNNFGETDNVIDLFAEIENAYGGGYFYIRQNNKGRFNIGVFSVHLFRLYVANVDGLAQLQFAQIDDERKGRFHIGTFKKSGKILADCGNDVCGLRYAGFTDNYGKPV